MDIDTDFLCPKCRRRFTNSRGVLAHLNHKKSSCHDFLDDDDALSAFVEEETQQRARFVQERSLPTFWNRVPSPAPSPAPAPAPAPAPTPPHVNTTTTEYHSCSSFIYGQKANTFERIAGDRFAHRRVNNPYYPFQGREEWGLARFLARSSLSQSEIDEFLKLEWVQRLNPTFTSAHALRSLIESLPDPPRWYCDRMVIEGYETEHPIYFYWRDALSVIEYIFGNPVFASYMQYDPQRLWTDASRTERIYSEYMTGDFAWQSQVHLPDGATQLAVVGGSDKTCVTAMTGGLEMYPAYLSLANIVSEVRMKASNHAWMCFCFLPIVKFRVHPSFQSILSARLWHACMDKAFARCKDAAITGCFVADPHGRLRWSFPLLAAWIADLPEQHLISAVANSTSPHSLAVTNQFGDAHCHSPRHGLVTIKLIQDLTSRVDPWKLGAFQDKAKELGLNGVHLPFWRDWYLANPFHFLVPEILHTCHKFFFDHPLQWCINAVGAFELDSRFRSLHPRVGFRHFGNGVARVQQMTGREHRDIQRSIIAVIAGAVPPSFLRAIRALIDFIYQVQSPFLTESAISSFVDSLKEFHDEKAAITAAGARIGTKGPITHFNIPKLELWQHFACSTKMMGAPIQWTADVTERLHITEVKHPFRATNHRNFEEQCARILDRLERVKLFDFFCKFLANGDLKPSNPVVTEAVLTAQQDLHPVLPPTVATCEEIVMSQRPMQNYFLKGLVSSNSLAAFHLNKTPDIASISIGEATHLYALQDFWPALGDFMSGLSHQQRRGRRVSRGCPDVGFEDIRIWFRFRIQLHSVHDQHVLLPAQTVQVLPPSQKHPHGLCDTVLIHGLGDAGDSGDESVQVRMLFQPISNERQNNPFLCYIEKFSFAGRRAEDGSRLEEQDVDMYLLRRQFRSQVLGNGTRMRMGDIIPLTDIAHTVDLVPVYGAQKNPEITAENSLDLPTEFYLNCFSDKEIYHTLLKEFS
ncbi:hypothetical protein EDB86DRAFT_2811651 [Lactarius hatsudake]|nr:hypothetical protein EDB86DRAFT_2811651 [Lactarius hatsudake]